MTMKSEMTSVLTPALGLKSRFRIGTRRDSPEQVRAVRP